MCIDRCAVWTTKALTNPLTVSIMLHILICTGGPPPKPYFEPGKTLLTGRWKLCQTLADVSAISWSATQADKSQYFMALNDKNSRGKHTNNWLHAVVGLANSNTVYNNH